MKTLIEVEIRNRCHQLRTQADPRDQEYPRYPIPKPNTREIEPLSTPPPFNMSSVPFNMQALPLQREIELKYELYY
jgi:hypothetical protein